MRPSILRLGRERVEELAVRVGRRFESCTARQDLGRVPERVLNGGNVAAAARYVQSGPIPVRIVIGRRGAERLLLIPPPHDLRGFVGDKPRRVQMIGIKIRPKSIISPQHWLAKVPDRYSRAFRK